MTTSPLEIGNHRRSIVVDLRRAAVGLVMRPRWAVPIALALLVLFGVCDYLTGIEVAFTLLYLIPVGIVTWSCGAAPGGIVAALATTSAMIAALSIARTRPWLVLWNCAGTLGVLVLAVVVLDRLRAHVESEQRERRYAVEQLRRAERLNIIGRLAAGVAHELGTPLNVISGNAELLQSPRLSPEKKAVLLDTIRGQASRISRIVRQLLDFGRGSDVAKERIDLNDLARATVGLLQNTATSRHCTIVFESHAAPIPVVANAPELEQVLSNLVLNGLQAMAGGGALKLTAAIEERPAASASAQRFGAVIVEDEGIGIAPSDLPRIFDPFFTTKEVGEGTGLGLSISYGIIRDHGGLLEVTSRPEAGTRFTALLPLAPESQ